MRMVTKRLAMGAVSLATVIACTWTAGMSAAIADDAIPEPVVTGDPNAPNGVVTPFGSCGQTFDPVLYWGPFDRIGSAHWALTCSSGKITVKGWVLDEDADGQCVQVRATFNGGIVKESKPACRSGQKNNFSWTYGGTIADAVVFAYEDPDAED